MKDWGTYRRLYETLSPDFERLPYSVRCMSADLLRRADRNGRIVPGTELNEKLVTDVSFHVRAHTGEDSFIRLALDGLLSDGYLIFESGYLTIRNFIKAQRSEAADRMAKKRLSDAGLLDYKDSDSDERDVTPPAGARALVSSHIVSSSISDPEENKPQHMTANWKPSAGQIKALSEKWKASEEQILSEVHEFIWYWTEGKGAKKRSNARGWAQTFGNRIAMVAESGKLYVHRPGLRELPIKKTAMTIKTQDTHEARQAALQRELAADTARARAELESAGIPAPGPGKVDMRSLLSGVGH